MVFFLIRSTSVQVADQETLQGAIQKAFAGQIDPVYSNRTPRDAPNNTSPLLTWSSMLGPGASPTSVVCSLVSSQLLVWLSFEFIFRRQSKCSIRVSPS